MNKERWVLAGVAVVALSIWGFLLFTIFSTPEEPEIADSSPGENGNGLAEMYEDALGDDETFPSSGNDPADVPDSEIAPEDGASASEDPVQEEEASDGIEGDAQPAPSMRTRGIYPGDFQDIAPDGIASIDDVLERLEEE